jgi:putative colanic acid biosysnthesis UDP-glucose lipid carrier transferase
MQKKNKIITKTSKYIKFFMFLIDFILLNLSFIVTIYFFYLNSFDYYKDWFYSFIIFSNLIWILMNELLNSNSINRVEPLEKIIARTLKMLLCEVTILFLVAFVIQQNKAPKLFVIIFSLQFITYTIVVKTLLLLYIERLRKKGFQNKNLVVLGVNNNSIELKKILKKELSYGYKILGYFDDTDLDKNYLLQNNINLLGKIDDFYSFVEENDVHEVFITGINNSTKYNKELIVFCEKNFVRVKIIPNFQQLTLNRHVTLDFYGDIPVLLLRKEPLENLFNKTIKRIFDIIFSLFVILFILSWIYPIVALIQKLTSKGKILFVQERSGQDNIVFKCLKFRTMIDNEFANKMGTLVNDPRITPFGKFLRKSRIDELPQFINVFLGQMSVVGPRPHMLKHTEEYSKLIDEFLVRHYVKPGITGWAQTTGYIDESKKLQEMLDKVKNDIWYIENWSFLLDIRIILMTVFKVFRGDKNAY